jgi:prepilin-type processing-associated H-X9-DG protein
MTGYPLPTAPAQPAADRWNTDLPGAYHDRAGGISFCDGHAEIHKWLQATTTPPLAQGILTDGGGAGPIFPVPYSADVAWMQNASARPH